MAPELHKLTTPLATLCYQKRGSGNDVLLCFHGFGQDHAAFNHVSPLLDSQYTWYSFDLFFHGNSSWKKGNKPITKQNWEQIITAFLTQEKINRFSLLGYSLGSRFLLVTFESFPDRTNSILLIAPAGITEDSFYRLATSTAIMRTIFRVMVKHGKWFFTLSKIINAAGLLNSRTVRFAESQMKTEEKRNQVYYSWVVFRKLNVGCHTLANLLNRHRPKLAIMIGSQDTVIPQHKITPLTRKLSIPFMLELADAQHHQLLKKEWISKLV